MTLLSLKFNPIGKPDVSVVSLHHKGEGIRSICTLKQAHFVLSAVVLVIGIV